MFHPKPIVGLVTQMRGHFHQVSRVMSKKINPKSNLFLKKEKWFYSWDNKASMVPTVLSITKPMGMVPGGAPVNSLGHLYLLPVSHPSWTLHGHPHLGFLVYFLPPYICWVTYMQRPWAGALISPHWQPSVPLVQEPRDILQGWNIHPLLAASVSFLCSRNLCPLHQVCLILPVSPGLSLWETLILPDPMKSNPSLLQPHL